MTAAPWYRRTVRWAQTNLTEKDPAWYDADWWRDQWRRTRVQGAIINAGGIVAYYPSKFPLQHRAEFLGDRDLYGEIVAAARSEGLVVLARMDSNRAHQEFYDAHPDWFAIDADGNPYRAGDLYVACVTGPYYREHLTGVLEEIIERSAPDGITDNSWSGLDRDHICYCPNCSSGFKEAARLDLPGRVDWDDPAYRRWILWSYQQRMAVWDLNNDVTTRAGG
ncbi:MAG TPA: beta-galactosidase, partial [Kribbella sp.]